MKNKIILTLLIVIFTISSYFFIKEFAENKKEKDIYEDLQEIVHEQKNPTNENNDDLKNETSNNYNLENISKINFDIIGWIKIDGTNINYPVMQNQNYYLHRNIYKKYSNHGTPYLAEYCNLKTSDNQIIYGHNMKDNTMFAQLEYYKKYDFYKNHKYIKFYTLENGQTVDNTYEIVFAFKTVAYSSNEFKYYNYTKFNEKDFISFVDNCQKLQFYNITTNVDYGDKLLTLSTCEYSQKNGRMVVVAKKI